jgi:toxin ParE1/3/4
MSVSMIVSPEAEADIESAQLWYEHQRAGLGDAFIEQLEAVFETISTHPEMFRIYRRDVRRAMLRRFPYAVMYRVTTEGVHVLAVMHAGRRPSAWEDRV